LIVATYDYTDEHGNLLYQVVRYQPKDFKQRRPDGCGGWIWRKGARQVLYRLPEVLEAPIVFVVEGERDVETLRSQGFVATTNAGGAKAPWLQDFTESLGGREVILIPYNDAPGRARVLTIARALLGKAARLVVLELEGGKDITDWFARGHSETELIALVEGQAVSQ
jgi:DNA primase